MSNIRFKSKQKGRMGLYAQYSKADGCHIQTKEMNNHSAYNSNKDCFDAFWDLITEKNDYMHYDWDLIPKKSPNWSDSDIEEYTNLCDPDLYTCEMCDDHFKYEDMSQLADEDEGILMSVCKKCNDE